MTIDELADRVALEFIQENNVRIETDGPKFRALVVALLGMAQEVARDQRHACAEAVLAIDRNAWSMGAAHQAVMNAEIR